MKYREPAQDRFDAARVSDSGSACFEPGRAWSRNDCWIGSGAPSTKVTSEISIRINRLRKKLEADPKNPHYVLTVRGVGYKFGRKNP